MPCAGKRFSVGRATTERREQLTPPLTDGICARAIRMVLGIAAAAAVVQDTSDTSKPLSTYCCLYVYFLTVVLLYDQVLIVGTPAHFRIIAGTPQIPGSRWLGVLVSCEMLLYRSFFIL